MKKTTKGLQINSTVKCPLCKEGSLDYHYANVHYWVCSDCPFVGFEYYSKGDTQQLNKALK